VFQDQKGEVITIYGTSIELPPVPPAHEIEDWGQAPEEQYWRRLPFPAMFNVLGRDALGNIVLTAEQEVYCLKELSRIKDGFWFYINGVPTYITGRHYYYLKYWTLENKKAPEYRDTSRRYYLYLDHWRRVYWCLGILRGKGRRTGATSESTSNGVYEATTVKNSNCGVLSKTNTDARKLFLYRLQFGYRHMPFFLQPTLSNAKDSKTELVWSVPLESKYKKATLIDAVEGLNSRIDYQGTALNSYDQERLTWLLADEGGKWPPEVPFSQFLSIVAETFVEGVERVGFGEFPTTLNEMTKKGGAEYKKAWDGATWQKKNLGEEMDIEDDGTEETANRFVRYFCAAYDGLPGFVGKYGESIIDPPNLHQARWLIAKYGEKKYKGQLSLGAKAYLEKRRSKLLGAELEEEIRKYPFNEVDMFMMDSSDCPFNQVKINEQIKYLEEKPPFLRQVTFYRKEDQTVGWRDDKNGLWWILAFPPDGQQNKFKWDGRLRKPGRTSDGTIGVDGYSNSQGGRKYGSMACAMIYRKFDINDPENTGCFIGMDYGRPQYKELMHDQMMFAGEYFGYEVFYEHTADDYLGHFRSHGRIGYLGSYPMSAIDPYKRDKTERYKGFPITPFAMTKQLDTMILFIEEYCHKIYFLQFLKQALPFDPYNRTEYDCIVAGMIAVVSALDVVYKPTQRTTPFVKTYINENYGRKKENYLTV
jgi:hypothetical protein